MRIVRDIADHKQVEETLRASESYLEEIFNSIFTGVVVVDEKTHEIVDANPYALETIGASKEHVIGKVCHRFICPAEKGKCPISDLGQTVDRSERVLLRANGERIPILKSVTTTMWRGRRYLIESFIDITERKKIEEALRESEEKFRLTFENAKDAILWADPTTGLIINCNKAAETLLEKKREEIIGHHQTTIHPPQKSEYYAKMFKRHIEQAGAVDDEAEVITKSGKIIPVHITASTTLVQGKPIIQGIFRDITERKKAEQALRESEEKYRELINGMNDTAWVIDFDCNFIDVNDAAVKVLGYSREELLSMRIFDIDFSLDPEKIRGLVKGMPTDQIQVFETAHTTKDGKTIPVEISSSLVTYRGKRAILSIARDITERKKMEERLLESEERLRNLYENIPDSLCVFVGREGRLLEYNKAFKKRTGYTDEELKDKMFLNFVHSDDRAMIQEKYRTKYPEEAFPLVFEIKEINKKGELLLTEASVSTYKKRGKVIGIEVLHRDITERKAMEEKLRQYSERLEELVQKRTEELLESEKRYSVLVEEASDGVAIVQDGKIVFVNKGASEIAGYLRDELIGLPLEKLVDEKYHQLVKERYMLRMRGEIVPATYEVEFIAKTSERIPVEVSATLISYQSRPADLIIVRDIRERKRMEEQRLKLEKLAAIGELATMVGHDLRNPLQSIENAIYYLKNECAPKLPVSIPQKAKEMFQVISDSVDYADKIIRDLQDFSTIKTPKLEKTDINAIIKETLSQVQIPTNVKFRTKLGYLPEVEADKDQIQRVFLNLTKNGMEAMKNGGTLTVSTKKTNGFVEISFQRYRRRHVEREHGKTLHSLLHHQG